jgi:hypothetical protein
MDTTAAPHRLDAARLFRLALEKGTAGARYHGVAEEGVRLRDIAAAICRRLNVSVVSKSSAEATKYFSWLAAFLPVDNPTSSRLTQERPYCSAAPAQWRARMQGRLHQAIDARVRDQFIRFSRGWLQRQPGWSLFSK